MSTFFSSVTVIFIVGIVGTILYKFFEYYSSSDPTPDDNKVKNKASDDNEFRETSEPCPTMLINQVILQVLNKNGTVKREIPLPRIPSAGLSLGKSSNDKVRISEGVVSRHHCDLGEDEKGLFIIDNNSTNGIYTSKDLKHRVKQISVVFGEVYYIANIPVRFKSSNALEAISDVGAKTQKYFGNRDIKPGVLQRVE